jgi:hypothetical protein
MLAGAVASPFVALAGGIAGRERASLLMAVSQTPTSRGVAGVARALGTRQGYNLNDIGPTKAPQVSRETPLPAALPLFGTGLGLMGLAGWWRKRRAAN